jgi:hypothetical protein
MDMYDKPIWQIEFRTVECHGLEWILYRKVVDSLLTLRQQEWLVFRLPVSRLPSGW